MYVATVSNSSHGSEAKHSAQSLPEKHVELYNTISAMLQKEKHYACPDWLEHGTTKKAGGRVVVDASCRAKVCRWIFRTVEHARMKRETAIIAISYLDRFLWSKSSRASRVQRVRIERARRDRREYQLVAMTSLYVAIKINEPIEMDAMTMSQLSRGLQSAQDIISCEQDILSCLRWKMNGPTSYQFISYILELLPDSTNLNIALQLYTDSHRQVELSVQDPVFVPIRRSNVAIAAILNALNGIELIDFPSEKRAAFLQSVFESFGIQSDSPLLRLVRKRLLHISHIALRCRAPQSQSPRRVDRFDYVRASRPHPSSCKSC